MPSKEECYPTPRYKAACFFSKHHKDIETKRISAGGADQAEWLLLLSETRQAAAEDREKQQEEQRKLRADKKNAVQTGGKQGDDNGGCVSGSSVSEARVVPETESSEWRRFVLLPVGRDKRTRLFKAVKRSGDGLRGFTVCHGRRTKVTGWIRVSTGWWSVRQVHSTMSCERHIVRRRKEACVFRVRVLAFLSPVGVPSLRLDCRPLRWLRVNQETSTVRCRWNKVLLSAFLLNFVKAGCQGLLLPRWCGHLPLRVFVEFCRVLP